MNVSLISFALVLVLVGCGPRNLIKPEEASGSKTGLAMIGKDGKLVGDAFVKQVWNEENALPTTVREACVPKVDKPFALTIGAIAAPVGKLLFDWMLDNKRRKLEGLKKAAQTQYSAKLILSNAPLSNFRCAVLVRYKEKLPTESDLPTPETKEQVGLVGVIQLISKPDSSATQTEREEAEPPSAFVLKPIYVRAESAAVVTARPGKKEGSEKPAQIDAAIALSVKAIGQNVSGLPGLVTVGEGVVSVPNIPLGHVGKVTLCQENCEPESATDTSDLIPYPPAKAVTSVTMSITETGHVGINFDQRTAELKAVQEALGPALKDSIKEAWAD